MPAHIINHINNNCLDLLKSYYQDVLKIGKYDFGKSQIPWFL